MKKRVRGTGSVWQRKHGGWTIAYYVDGAERRESVAVALNKAPALVTEREAHALLTDRLAALGRGEPVTAEAARLTVKDAVESWYAALVEKHAKSLGPSASKKKHFLALLGHVRIARLTPDIVRQQYIAPRREAGATDGTIHGELLSLTAAINLLRKEGRLTHVPFIPKPPAAAARQGYPEPEELAAILPHVDHEASRDALEYADATGRRKGEVIALTWAQVFQRDGEIRMGETKNGDKLTIPIVGTVASVIERRVQARQMDSLYVFHDHGLPLDPKTLLERLKRACGLAGRPVQLVHDLRRSGVRNLMRTPGVTETVAMSISGHRDRKVFQRYNITSTEDQRAALQGAAAYRAQRIAGSSPTVVPIS